MNKPEQAKQLPSIEMDTDPFVESAKTADPAKIADQLRHCQQQLALTQFYPGRNDKLPKRQ